MRFMTSVNIIGRYKTPPNFFVIPSSNLKNLFPHSLCIKILMLILFMTLRSLTKEGVNDWITE